MTTPRPRTERSGFNPTAHLVASLDGGPYFTIGEVSEITGVPANTLRNWRMKGKTKGPSQEAQFGERVIYLYTTDDIAEIRARRPSGGATNTNRTAA